MRTLMLAIAMFLSGSGALSAVTPPFATVPRPAWAQGDPADSLYRVARRALTDNDYATAARSFDAILTRYPKSTYGPDALYWKGFALYRDGDLDGARRSLEAQASRFPDAPTRSDGAALLIAVKGELAKRGDASARHDVDQAAATSSRGCQDMEVQLAALDAVQRMDPDGAVPLLQRVLARRDDCSVPLRKNALFILAQRSGGDREKILLDVAKSDPNLEVRKDAVFHLSAAHSALAVDALEELLLRGSDPSMRSDALYSLAQMNTDRTRQIVREFALSPNAPANLRKDAFYQIAQKAKTDDDVAWLRQAYPRVDDASVRSDLLYQIAIKPSAETSKWLVGVAMDQKESMEARKNALYYLAQRKNDPAADMTVVYDAAPASLKKDVMYFIAQRKDDRSLDKLIAIAKSDPSTEMRKEALYYVGQSKDPKALKALEEIVVP